MNKKLPVIIVMAAVLLAGIAIYYHALTPDAYEILHSSKSAVENLDSLRADAYFLDSTDTDVLNEYSKYSMKIELLRTEEKGKTMKINFESYEYECPTEEKEAAYESLRQSLRNAWILDTPDKFYVYSPMVLKESVTEFTPQPSLMRYKFIPIIDPLHLALLFDHAENASYEGIQTINMGNTSVEAYVVSYKLSYPAIKFAREATLRTWISTHDYIPLKTEAYATYATAGGTAKMEFGFENYEKDVSIPPANLSLPDDLNVIQRV